MRLCVRACVSLHERGREEGRWSGRAEGGVEKERRVSAAAVALRVYASTRIYAGGKSDGPADAPCAGAPYRSAVSRAA